MPNMTENIITGAAADPKAHTVALSWANGEKTVSSFAHLVGKGIFAAFADPAFFAQVRIGEGGRSLEWPGDLDFCADALWFEHHLPGRRASRARVVAAGLTDDDIDRLIKQAQQEVEPLLG